MNRLSTIILLVIALGLTAYILLVERHSLTSGELADTREQLLPRFVRNRVNAISISREGQRIELRRERQNDSDPIGDWQMRSPVNAEADPDTIGSMLSSLQFAHSRRTLQSVSDEDIQRFGLEAPRVRATFEVGSEEVRVAFGNEDPTESGVYMMAGDQVHVVGVDVFEALDHEPGHWRTKRLLTQGVVLAEGLELRGEAIGGTLNLRRENSTWKAGEVLLSASAVEAAIQAMNDLEASRFLGDEGLGETWLEATAQVPATAAHEAREVRIVVGELCSDPTQRKMRVDEEGAETACVLASRFDPMIEGLDAWREMRPVTTNDLELASLELSDASATLAVQKGEDDVFRYTLTRGENARSGQVDAGALAEWLQAIRRSRASDVRVRSEEATEPLRGRTIRIERTDGSREELVLFGGELTGDGSCYAERGGEVFRFGAALWSLMRPSAIHLRPRRIYEHSASDVQQLVVQRGSVREEVALEDGRWQVTQPVQMAADRENTRELAGAIARLTIDQFVADSAAPMHGFDDATRVSATLDDGTELRVEIGAEVPGEETRRRFARAGEDPTVFTVSGSLVDRAMRPLASLRQLDTDVLFIDRMTVINEAGTIALTHNGERFLRDDQALEVEASEALGQSMEGLSARYAVRYGPALESEGLNPPRARVELRRGEGGEEPRDIVILVGAPTGIEGEIYVRREDLNVTFAASESRLRPILELR